MSDPMSIMEACGVTQQFGRFLKGMDRLHEAAEALKGLDQLITERQALASSLQEQITAARAELAAVQVQAATAIEESVLTVQAADERARGMVNQATLDASATTVEAKAQVEAAQAELQQIADVRASLQAEIDALQDQIADGRAIIEKANVAKAALAAVV